MAENTAHDALVEEATEAIQAVHGDTSVSQQETINSLRTLMGECEMLIQAVESDMQQSLSSDSFYSDEG